MIFLWTKILAIFYRLRNGMIFLPSVIIIVILGVGILLITLKSQNWGEYIQSVPFVKIHELETVRSILNAFLTGLISITVFSFSMVMLVLSQAAANYSPRILSWMVSERSNQYILGFYLGTILLNILLLLQLPENEYAVPSFHFAVLLDALLTFYCLILFVSFINRVSNDIQITHITQNIFVKTSKKLLKEEKTREYVKSPTEQNSNWKEYVVDTSGYLQRVMEDDLLRILIANDLRIQVWNKFGFYYLKESPLYSLNKEVTDKKVLEDIDSTFIFYPGERIEDHTFYGFKQLSEIAVKALSPGINDPGTANQCLDYLTDLFYIRMNCDLPVVIRDKKGIDRIIIHNYSIQNLIKACLIPILQYGGQDIRILENFLTLLRQLGSKDKERRFQKDLNDFAQAVLFEIEKTKKNKYLYDHLEPSISSLKGVANNYYFLSLISPEIIELPHLEVTKAKIKD